MNARNLSKQSATDCARIDRMTDEEIDTSDIPPLDDAFFARAKWHLPRSYIDLNDFRQARKFAAYILKHKLHETRKTKAARARQELEHLAFNTALIISYSRPFHLNNNLEGQPRSSLRKHICQLLSKPEVDVHSRVLAMRDTAYAHSDARSHLFEGFDYSRNLAFYKPIDILDKSETEHLKLIISKWINYLELEKSKMKESLKRA